MRKLIVSMWITLDGFVAGPDDEMDWLKIDDQLMRYEQDLVEGADTLLLGRITHTDFASYWPEVINDPGEPDEVRNYARRVHAMEKIVVSASGNTTPWQNTRRLETVDPDRISELKHGPGGDIVLYGSLTVIRALADLGLVDEYHLLAHPVFLRQGKALFQGDRPVPLKLASAHALPSGVVLMKYRPIHE
ncbi:dihydrofolate reductase family protein [Nonomuraea sp. SBT364]|uniref:dihydrofolate reductase family protein n=1 Tax=Nonomuraea sp. SBT364 TaxID=1580530 RepID=UPI0007C82482|nr:dihydrofolate reductase family protein [Nonomuraea sp. SBT364]